MLGVRHVSIRRARAADAGEIVTLGRMLDPTQLATLATFRVLLDAAAPPTTERLVAEAGGQIVGWAPSGLYDSGRGWFWIGVHPQARARGIGGAIYRHLEARLRGEGAERIETTPNDEPGRAFLRRRGFAVSATVRVSELDLRNPLPTVQAQPEHAVVPLRDAIDRPETLFELYAEGRADVPSQTPRTEWSYSEWRAETLDHPLIDLDASVVILEDTEPVSLAWLYSDREGHRAENLMAATRRDRRGHGLATLAKIESTRKAAELGITRILTSNDVGNAPMRAINQKLGYTSTLVVQSYAKSLVERHAEKTTTPLPRPTTGG